MIQMDQDAGAEVSYILAKRARTRRRQQFEGEGLQIHRLLAVCFVLLPFCEPLFAFEMMLGLVLAEFLAFAVSVIQIPG